uniref:Programmed cell death protein 5 n=3 Tax=Timema TaxID=61471 RepID=A0A7R9FZ35_TIMSH|nr:unnamed protein product [Timema douglasi]CAD7260737.1 unnamed protein product [Timema shepardi]
MGDSDLDEIRARRLNQLQSQYKGGQDGGSQQKAAEERKQIEEMKHNILTQVLTQEARARLNTLMIGKPEKGQIVENMLIQMARSGQLMEKLDEQQLISILEKVSKQMQKTSTVKFDRRRAALDDSDEDL